MQQDSGSLTERPDRTVPLLPLDEVVRRGARQLLQTALDVEVALCLDMAKEGVLDRETTQAPIIAFLAQVFAQNSDKLSMWFKELSSLQEAHYDLVLRALWHSNMVQTNAFLRTIADQSSEKVRDRVNELLRRTPLTPLNAPMVSPAVLDILWGAFFATGDEQYIERIISVLPWLETKGNVDRLLIGGAAQWSLTSNAVQHQKVLNICQKQLRKQPKEVKAILQEIVDNALKEIHTEGKKAASSIPVMRECEYRT